MLKRLDWRIKAYLINTYLKNSEVTKENTKPDKPKPNERKLNERRSFKKEKNVEIKFTSALLCVAGRAKI